jgi:hypothetical protein
MFKNNAAESPAASGFFARPHPFLPGNGDRPMTFENLPPAGADVDAQGGAFVAHVDSSDWGGAADLASGVYTVTDRNGNRVGKFVVIR